MKTPAKIPVWLAHTLLVVAAMCVVSVSGWYSPFLTASGWHVFHPHGWVDYRGLHIRVPWPWTAEDTEAIDDDPTVTPLGVALKKMPYEMIRRLAPAVDIRDGDFSRSRSFGGGADEAVDGDVSGEPSWSEV